MQSARKAYLEVVTEGRAALAGMVAKRVPVEMVGPVAEGAAGVLTDLVVVTMVPLASPGLVAQMEPMATLVRRGGTDSLV